MIQLVIKYIFWCYIFMIKSAFLITFFTWFSPSPACFLWQQHKCSIEQEQEDLLNQAYHWGRRHVMIPITICGSKVCINALWGNEPSLLLGKQQVSELCWEHKTHIPCLFWLSLLLLNKLPTKMNELKKEKGCDPRRCSVDREGSILESIHWPFMHLTPQNNCEHVESDKERENVNQHNLTQIVQGIWFWQARVWF